MIPGRAWDPEPVSVDLRGAMPWLVVLGLVVWAFLVIAIFKGLCWERESKYVKGRIDAADAADTVWVDAHVNGGPLTRVALVGWPEDFKRAVRGRRR